MKITNQHIIRATQEFLKHAKEEISVEYDKGFWVIYGSELACLRLFHTYRGSKDAYVGFSKNLNTYYFSYDSGF